MRQLHSVDLLQNFFLRKDSDLDILFMKASITGAYLVTFKYDGLEVTIFIISKQHIYRDFQKYLYGYHNMPLTFGFFFPRYL